MRRLKSSVCLALLLVPLTAHAGMSMPTFTDIAKARMEVISFFLFMYFVLAFIYRWLWNSLREDFPKLPRLSYRGALAALTVCGLFVYVVLTMISGARELMTPGAWSRSGVMYKIRDPDKDPQPWLDAARNASMERLRGALWQYAAQHSGNFPESREESGFPDDIWRSIDPDGLQLIYIAGLKADKGRDVLAYEPGTFGATRFTLFTNGEVVQLKAEELSNLVLKQLEPPDPAAAPK